MQEIEVDAVSAEPLQTPLAGSHGACVCRVLWQHLGHDEALVTPPLDSLGNDKLCVGIKLGGVDQRHAEIEPKLQRRDLLTAAPPAFAHVPGALAELRHLLTGRQRHYGKTENRHEPLRPRNKAQHRSRAAPPS